MPSVEGMAGPRGASLGVVPLAIALALAFLGSLGFVLPWLGPFMRPVTMCAFAWFACDPANGPPITPSVGSGSEEG